MIIGITIRDNDYHDLLAKFCHRLSAGELIMEKEPHPDAPEAGAWYAHYMDVTRRALPALKNHTDMADPEVKKLITDAVQESWRWTIRNSPEKEYLQGRLEVTLLDSITDNWENGEQFYVFTTSYEDHVLCF